MEKDNSTTTNVATLDVKETAQKITDDEPVTGKATKTSAESSSASSPTTPPLGIRIFFIFFLAKMECLLCYFKSDEQTLKAHYEGVHRVDPTNPHFRNLFRIEATTDKKCRYCERVFLTPQQKKNHVFLRHYRRLPLIQPQVGSGQKAFLNILHRGKIVEFSINFEQHRDHYNFFDGDIVPRFLDVVHKNFVPEPNTKYKFHGFFEILNWRGLPNESHPTARSWFTNIYRFSHFNGFVRQKMKEQMLNKIINNKHSGSSWHFFRFESLKVIVASLKFAQDFCRT